MSKVGITLSRHIMEQQWYYPGATGDFTGLLMQIALAGKVIAREVSKAGLVNILGFTGDKNVQGEEVTKLDLFAHNTMLEALEASGHICIMASEEAAEPILPSAGHPRGNYAVLFDPLDGSSNIDINITIGTIFSIHRKISIGADSTAEDLLQPGDRQIAAGYIVYGSSTMFVYTTGHGVHGFTLDPSLGEFLLSHENISMPKRGDIYSANEGNYHTWSPGVQRYVDDMKRPGNKPYKGRYVGTLVADFHRTLLIGGIFLYPADMTNPAAPAGKLRLLYEAAPLAFVAQQAGGRASTGSEDILSLQPNELHQRVPLFIGSEEDVSAAEDYIRQMG
ncbi:MAG: class 1 fructose-bisphosphatase [bacterium]|nr:class 1 fructose-bisphosphatase [bacterium]